jgi:hypothetical protein
MRCLPYFTIAHFEVNYQPSLHNPLEETYRKVDIAVVDKYGKRTNSARILPRG